MATHSDESRPGSESCSLYDGASSHGNSESELQTSIDTGSTATVEPGTKSSILLAQDPFVSDDSKLLFEAIDEMRKCGAGKDLDLPQVWKQ
jgi:hypothetical protein